LVTKYKNVDYKLKQLEAEIGYTKVFNEKSLKVTQNKIFTNIVSKVNDELHENQHTPFSVESDRIKDANHLKQLRIQRNNTLTLTDFVEFQKKIRELTDKVISTNPDARSDLTDAWRAVIAEIRKQVDLMKIQQKTEIDLNGHFEKIRRPGDVVSIIPKHVIDEETDKRTLLVPIWQLQKREERLAACEIWKGEPIVKWKGTIEKVIDGVNITIKADSIVKEDGVDDIESHVLPVFFRPDDLVKFDEFIANPIENINMKIKNNTTLLIDAKKLQLQQKQQQSTMVNLNEEQMTEKENEIKKLREVLNSVERSYEQNVDDMDIEIVKNELYAFNWDYRGLVNDKTLRSRLQWLREHVHRYDNFSLEFIDWKENPEAKNKRKQDYIDFEKWSTESLKIPKDALKEYKIEQKKEKDDLDIAKSILSQGQRGRRPDFEGLLGDRDVNGINTILNIVDEFLLKYDGGFGMSKQDYNIIQQGFEDHIIKQTSKISGNDSPAWNAHVRKELVGVYLDKAEELANQFDKAGAIENYKDAMNYADTTEDKKRVKDAVNRQYPDPLRLFYQKSYKYFVTN
jgi:hypothetical protein